MAILNSDDDLKKYDPAVTRLVDATYSQSDFADQRTEALAWLNRCIDLNNPQGIDRSEEDRADGYLLEKEELERAAAYYALYLIYQANIKSAGDPRDVKSGHWRRRAYETLNNATVEFDTDGDGDTNYSYRITSARIARG